MDSSKIIAIISKISRKPAGYIYGHLSLNTLGLSSSFGLSALRSQLELESKSKLSQSLNGFMKVDDLVALFADGQGTLEVITNHSLSPTPLKMTSSVATPSPTFPGNIGLGMDMQEIEMLPVVEDFRTDNFYATHFSQSELATAILHPSPRTHLCGIFCAKEAAKKSHPDLLDLRMSDILVSHDASGRPLLRLAGTVPFAARFHFVLSITHTEQLAAATCISLCGNE